MKKLVFALLLGIVIGYFYGFADAKEHDQNVVARTVAKVGGSNRSRFSNDVDRETERITR